MYNYSAVVEAMRISGFDDIVGGDGSVPSTPPTPPEMTDHIRAAIEPLLAYH
ncbi:MAG: hypothetical protein HC802_20115 [Caldilineaceae bacterium]|nr:hypothetical protein [Caldilineaceae bacterium]